MNTREHKIYCSDTRPEGSNKKYPFSLMLIGDYIVIDGYSRPRMQSINGAFNNWAKYRHKKGELLRTCGVNRVDNRIVLTRLS